MPVMFSVSLSEERMSDLRDAMVAFVFVFVCPVVPCYGGRSGVIFMTGHQQGH